MEKYLRPPLGVIPRKLYGEFLQEDILINGGMCLMVVHEKRLSDLSGAIARYAEVKRHIDPEWVKEYNETLELLSVYKNSFKL